MVGTAVGRLLGVCDGAVVMVSGIDGLEVGLSEGAGVGDGDGPAVPSAHFNCPTSVVYFPIGQCEQTIFPPSVLPK